MGRLGLHDPPGIKRETNPIDLDRFRGRPGRPGNEHEQYIVSGPRLLREFQILHKHTIKHHILATTWVFDAICSLFTTLCGATAVSNTWGIRWGQLMRGEVCDALAGVHVPSEGMCWRRKRSRNAAWPAHRRWLRMWLKARRVCHPARTALNRGCGGIRWGSVDLAVA